MYYLVICPVDPYVRRNAEHTSGLPSMLSLACVGAFAH